jgi:hypothetical protein
LTDAAGEAAKLSFNQWSAGFACSHCVRLSPLRGSVESPTRRFSELSINDPQE